MAQPKSREQIVEEVCAAVVQKHLAPSYTRLELAEIIGNLTADLMDKMTDEEFFAEYGEASEE